MKINRIFKPGEPRYIWLNLLRCTSAVYAILDVFDDEKIIYYEKESKKHEDWPIQEKNMEIITKQFNDDYLTYNKIVHQYVISDGMQLSL